MGIGRFYRWLSERYPLINEKITQAALPEFDNLYLDMNGILHNCSHGNSGGCLHDEEEAMWVSVFAALDSIISTINPKKLLVLAADGVAPRAKMNQQRTRRYRAAKDAAEAAEKKEAYEIAKQHLQRQAGVAFQGGGKANKKKKGLFDSNCISPGTEFMAKFFKHLRFFCEKKLNEDSRWKDLKVILSGPDVPGEGEHKIMNFLRCSKTDPKTDRNTRHCLYGLDADLIMLALASHEPHFCLLREEVFFGRSVSRRPEDCLLTKGENLQLLHISLLREYLFMEFPCPSPPPSARRLLSSSSPSSSSHSPSGPGGRFHPSNVQQVMNGNSTSSTSTTTRSSRTQGGGGGGGGRKEVKSGEEEEEFSSALQNGDEERRHLATGREGKEDPNSSVNLYRKSICGSDSDSCPYEWKPSLLYPRERERMIDDFVLFCFMVGNDFLPHPKATDIADGGLNALMNCYKQYLRNYYTLADNAASPRGPWLSFDCGRIDFCNFFLFLSLFVDTVEVELLEDLAGDSDWLQSKQSSHREAYMEAIDENLDSCQRYRYTFYYTKMKINPNTQDGSQELDRLARKYLEGLQWVLYYYYRGPCHSGWEWYYPYHYSPFLIDVLQCSFFTEDVETLSDLRKKRISFPPSKPFSPFLQLLSILPPRSAALLPRCLHRLVAVPPPELAAFFPDDFEVDMEGCKVSWGGVALLPFIDENLLIRAAEPLFSRLTKEEIQRNTRGKVVLLYRDPQRHIKFLRSLARSSSSLGHLFTAAPTREEEEDLDSLRRRSFLYFPPDQGQESSIRQQKGGETRSPTSSRLGLYPGTNTRMVDRSRKTVSSLPSAFPDLLHSFVHEEVIEVLPPVVVQRRLRSLRRLNEKERRADEEEEKKNREREKIHHENLGRSLSMCTSNRDSGRGYRQRGGMEREREREEEEEERGSSGIFDLEEIDACRGSENVGEDHAFPNFVLEGTVKRLDEFPTFDRVKFTWEYFTGVQVFNTASKKTSISIKVTPPYASSSPSQKDSSSSPLLFSYSTDSPSRLSSSHAQQEGRHPSSSSTMMIDSSRTFYRRKDSQGTIPQGVGGRASPSHSKLTSIEAFSAERDFLAYLDSPLVYYDFPFLRLAKPIAVWLPTLYYTLSEDASSSLFEKLLAVSSSFQSPSSSSLSTSSKTPHHLSGFEEPTKPFDQQLVVTKELSRLRMIGIGTPAEPPPSSSSPSSFSRKSSRAYGSYSHSSSSPSSKDRNLFLPRHHHHHHPERHVSPSASSDFPHIITYALPGSHAALSKRLVHPACLPNSVVVEVLPVKSIELCEDSEEPLVTYEDKTVFRLLPLLSLPSPLPRRLIPPRHLSSSSLLNLPGSDGEKDEERRMPLDKKKEKREVNEQGEEEHHVVEMKRRGRGGDREKEKRGERRLSKQQEKEEESLMNGENGGFPDGTCVMISNPRDRMFGCIGETVKILPKEEEEDSHVIDHAKREKRDKDMKDEKICVVFRNPRAKFDSGQISQAKLELEISGQIVGRALPPPLYSVRDAARELRMPVAVFYALASSFYVRLDGRREDCGLHIISFARGEGQRAGGGGEADGETRGPDGCTSSFVPLYCPGYSYPSYMSQGHREEGRKRSPRRGGGRDAVQWRLFSHVLTPAALDAIEAILNEYPSVSACLSKAAREQGPKNLSVLNVTAQALFDTRPRTAWERTRGRRIEKEEEGSVDYVFAASQFASAISRLPCRKAKLVKSSYTWLPTEALPSIEKTVALSSTQTPPPSSSSANVWKKEENTSYTPASHLSETQKRREGAFREVKRREERGESHSSSPQQTRMVRDNEEDPRETEAEDAVCQIVSVDDLLKATHTQAIRQEALAGFFSLSRQSLDALHSVRGHSSYPRKLGCLLDLSVGQRVAYVRPRGCIAQGSRGTITGIFTERETIPIDLGGHCRGECLVCLSPRACRDMLRRKKEYRETRSPMWWIEEEEISSQLISILHGLLVEVLLDHIQLGAQDMDGRCSSLRLIRVPCSDLLPLVSSYGAERGRCRHPPGAAIAPSSSTSFASSGGGGPSAPSAAPRPVTAPPGVGQLRAEKSSSSLLEGPSLLGAAGYSRPYTGSECCDSQAGATLSDNRLVGARHHQPVLRSPQAVAAGPNSPSGKGAIASSSPATNEKKPPLKSGGSPPHGPRGAQTGQSHLSIDKDATERLKRLLGVGSPTNQGMNGYHQGGRSQQGDGRPSFHFPSPQSPQRAAGESTVSKPSAGEKQSETSGRVDRPQGLQQGASAPLLQQPLGRTVPVADGVRSADSLLQMPGRPLRGGTTQQISGSRQDPAFETGFQGGKGRQIGRKEQPEHGGNRYSPNQNELVYLDTHETISDRTATVIPRRDSGREQTQVQSTQQQRIFPQIHGRGPLLPSPLAAQPRRWLTQSEIEYHQRQDAARQKGQNLLNVLHVSNQNPPPSHDQSVAVEGEDEEVILRPCVLSRRTPSDVDGGARSFLAERGTGRQGRDQRTGQRQDWQQPGMSFQGNQRSSGSRLAR